MGKFPLIGNIEPVCPYCEKRLDAKPSKKKKCPHCGEFIYVRTRPTDNQRVLVTMTQKEVIEKQWRMKDLAKEEEIRKQIESLREWTYRAWKKGDRGPGEQGVFSSQSKETMIAELRKIGYVRGKVAQVDMEKEMKKEFSLPDSLWDKNAKEPLFLVEIKPPIYEFDYEPSKAGLFSRFLRGGK